MNAASFGIHVDFESNTASIHRLDHSHVAVIGIIVFYNWRLSANETIARMQDESSRLVEVAIERYIQVPLAVNEITHGLLAQKIVDLSDERQRTRLFPSVLQSVENNVYSFSYGMETGAYYGARRNESNRLEFMKSEAATGGRSQYYTLNEDLSVGNLAVQLGPFDPRTRQWYEAAKAKRAPTFSAVYKHFVLPDLAVSAVRPVVDEGGALQGVLGVHISLSNINALLGEISKYTNSTAYIVERHTGEVVANSTGQPNYARMENGAFQRVALTAMVEPPIVEAYWNYLADGAVTSPIRTAVGRYHVKVAPYTHYGLDWTIITLVDEAPYVKNLHRSMLAAGVLSAVAAFISIWVWTRRLRKTLQPIRELVAITDRFAHGEFTARAASVQDDEIGKLAGAFNKMAGDLQELIDNLEQRVAARTAELENSNCALRLAKTQLELSARTDFLTGLYNRRYMIEQLEEQIERCRCAGERFAIGLVDLDHFKHVNDQYGHDSGDEALRIIARRLCNSVRDTDLVARWGGEEFLIAFTGASRQEAASLAERIRIAVAQTTIAYGGRQLKLTLSAGVAVHQPDQSLDELIKAADDALYVAKGSGRNCVVVFPQ